MYAGTQRRLFALDLDKRAPSGGECELVCGFTFCSVSPDQVPSALTPDTRVRRRRTVRATRARSIAEL